MATSTTNLGLTKPAGTDKIRIAQINGNMDILDEKIGAVGNTSLQAQVTSQNEAITALNGKIGTVNANGTQCDTLDAVKTYLLSIHNSLADGEIKAVHMLFTLSYTGQYFIQNTRYVGYYTRINNATGSVSLTNRTGDIIVVGLTSATSTPAWEFNSINQAIAKLDSNTNETTDILASAVSCTKTTFFKTSGSSSYVGTLPSNDYKVSTFIVTIRSGGRFVTAINSVGAVATNYYNGSSWSGWQELELKSELSTTSPTVTKTANIKTNSVVGAKRNANVVSIYMDVYAVSTLSEYVNIASLSEAPSTNVYFVMIDANDGAKMCRLTSNGELQIHGTVADRNYMGSLTYIVNS